MNKPVEFPIAKLLKEKGFKEPVIKCYATFKENIVLHSIYYSEIPEDMNGTRHEIIPNVYPNPPYYSAPTIAQVIMWLYEKHEVWISVKGDDNKTFRYELHKWISYEPEKTLRQAHITFGGGIFDINSEEFNSPTEAYEAAIEYTLKNLI